MSDPSTFIVHSWNLWFGGQMVADGRAKLAATATTLGADLLLFQECAGDKAKELSTDLGFAHAQQGVDCALSSRFALSPVSTATDPYASAAWVNVPHARAVLAWSVHLAPWDYGPYAALRGVPAEQINSAPQEQDRQRQIARILEETDRLLASSPAREKTPVIIAGDFNCPATLDWNARSDRPDFAWLPTDAVLSADFDDAFRSIFPDPEQVKGDTWSPVEPLDKEPRDRIDFVFVRNLEVISARTIGVDTGDSPCAQADANHGAFLDLGGTVNFQPAQADNTYASDHQIVEVTLAVPR